MPTKIRLTLLSFFQFFVWGSWLISLGGYMGNTLGYSGLQIGAVYATTGIASIFMPGLLGIVADRWINTERVLGVSHLLAAVALLCVANATEFSTFYGFMLMHSLFYMPTIALFNAVCYQVLERDRSDVVRAFPPIRVWGTVGFIAAMWSVDFLGWTGGVQQLYLSAGAGLLMGLYSFTVPPSPPVREARKRRSWHSAFGLDALVLFRLPHMRVFFIFSLLLGAALQITNAFGGPFLSDFSLLYPDSFGVRHPNLLLSISQISETLFILAIPFFFSRYGIKTVIMLSITAWVFRFGLFGLGNPADKLYLLVLSMLVYGMAFDFFNISGSLFVEKEAAPGIRASAQGLFMIMSNGLGAMIGGMGSGWVVDYFTDVDGIRDWQRIWFTFAGYAFLLMLLFPFAFRYKDKYRKPVQTPLAAAG